MLKGYLDWPHAEQVFRMERRCTRVEHGKVTHQVMHGVGSLTAQEASKRLLELVRLHWQIENGLPNRCDETLREDCCCLHTGDAAQVMATINNLVLGLLLPRGINNVPQQRRLFAAHPQQLWQCSNAAHPDLATALA